jgi:hypothetical protein
VIFRVGGTVIMRLPVVMMMLDVLVNQPGVLKKRVRTRRHPKGEQG